LSPVGLSGLEPTGGKDRRRYQITRSLCYTEFVLKNVTITVSEEAARWARKKAAEENTSVSKLVGRMLEDQMRCTDEYWRAYERLKRIKPIPGLAAHRLTREEAHERR
jgi:hypothetical protein